LFPKNVPKCSSGISAKSDNIESPYGDEKYPENWLKPQSLPYE
jgi:hypothetical protein